MMKGSRTSPIKQEETSMREGILTVLRDLDHEPFAKPSSSIRRTLSADMSSKKWLSQNGFSLLPSPKNNTSPEVDSNNPYSTSPPSCKEESNPSQDDVWRSIVRSRKDHQDKACFIPPSLVKRSLSEKSLEVCTESLGSETGSGCHLSSYGSSEFSSCDGDDGEYYQEPEKLVTTRDPDRSEKFGIVPVKYKNAPIRPFPPPIHYSLSMNSRRESGRLVLEAVPGRWRNRFVAQRGNGRLVLTLSYETAKVDDGEKKKKVTEKLISLCNNYTNKKNIARWINKAIEHKEPQVITQALPPQVPRVSRMIPKPQTTNYNSAPLSTYEYFRRMNKDSTNSTVCNEGFVGPRVIGNKYTKPMLLKKNSDKYYNDDDDDRINMYGATKEYEIRDFKGCKEAKRSLLVWAPYCIATS